MLIYKLLIENLIRNSQYSHKIRGFALYQGQAALIAVIFMLAIMLSAVLGVSYLSVKEARVADANSRSRYSFFAAEAGIDDAVYRLKRGKNLGSSFSLNINGAQADITVTSSSGRREIFSSGSAVGAVRALKSVLLSGTTNVSFYYGAQVGEGGLDMQENARIEGAGGAVGNVYSNGPVTGDNGATITGDLTVATGISADPSASSTVCNQDQIVGQTNPQIDFAQSFKPSDSKALSKISLYVKKIGNASNGTARITADNAGSPAQTSLSNGTFSASLVGGSYGWVDVTFASPANLTSGTTYWLVLDVSRDANKYFVWCKDSGAGYTDGSPKYSQDWDDDPWTAVAGDLNFKTYLGQGISSVEGLVVGRTVRANTITNTDICGDAYYQTIDVPSLNFVNNPTAPTCSSPFTFGTAYPNSSDPPVANMPISDSNITSWKDDAAAGGTITGNCGDNGVAGCNIPDDGTLYLGPKKIIGNLVLTKKQTLVITGTIYLTGSVDMDSSSGATIKCDAPYGAQSCVIVTDSWMHIKNNSIFQGSGTSGSYLLMLTTLEGCNGGAQTALCTHHNAAIDLHNNATGAIFYNAKSMTNLHNGVNVTNLTSYKLSLENNALVTYEQGLENAQFSAGPAGGWDITNWEEVVP